MRFLYTRSGEILTLLTVFAVGFYLYHSLSTSTSIIDNENQAREIIIEIHRKALDNHDKGLKDSGFSLTSLSDKFPKFSKINQIKEQEIHLFSDDNYLYCMKKDFITSGAKEHYSRETKRSTSGFKVMAWPKQFSVDGELAFFIDQRGILAVSKNQRGFYEGLKSYPPDYSPAKRALDAGAEPSEYNGEWKID